MSNQTNIRVELQFTKNLGNYESLKIGIGIEDFKREGESTDEATDRVYAFVENKLMQKVSEIEDELKSSKGKK
jgi:hypothetical protein